MSSEEGQKHIYAQEHHLYYYYNNFRGHSQKESKTVQLAIAISSVNAAGIIASTYILLYKSFHCHKNLKLSQNTAKFVKRIYASKFSKGKYQNFVNSEETVTYDC